MWHAPEREAQDHKISALPHKNIASRVTITLQNKRKTKTKATTKDGSQIIFSILLFVVIGAAATLDAVIKFSDAMILALVFPNMVGLLLLFPKVKEELRRYLRAIKADARPMGKDQ